MTFSTGFAYLEGKCLNNVVWALKRFQGLFMRVDALPGVIVIDKDFSLMNAWDYMKEAWGSLVDCPHESSFDEYLKKFEMACSPWSMFMDYVCQTWVIPHKERFVKA